MCRFCARFRVSEGRGCVLVSMAGLTTVGRMLHTAVVLLQRAFRNHCRAQTLAIELSFRSWQRQGWTFAVTPRLLDCVHAFLPWSSLCELHRRQNAWRILRWRPPLPIRSRQAPNDPSWLVVAAFWRRRIPLRSHPAWGDFHACHPWQRSLPLCSCIRAMRLRATAEGVWGNLHGNTTLGATRLQAAVDGDLVDHARGSVA